MKTPLRNNKEGFVFSPKTSVNKSQGINRSGVGMIIDPSDVKSDLMALGIDVDEGLIKRMQSLGMDKLFNSTNKTADLVKSRQKVPPGVAPEITFRHNEEAEKPEVASSTMRPWDSLTFEVDIQKLSIILRELASSQSSIDPNIRVAVDSMIKSFSIQYTRSPNRFVRNLLGLPYDKSKEKEDVQGLILKSRFATELEFGEMIQRLKNDTSPEQIDTLFQLLYETKEFGGNKSAVVDLWLFLSLLKACSSEGRRSFDSKTSKVATDVEFWYKQNNLKLHSRVYDILHNGGGTPEESVSNLSNNVSSPSRSSMGTLRKERTCMRGSDACELLKPQPIPRQIQDHQNRIAGRDSVAKLLGSDEVKSKAELCQGRCVVGEFDKLTNMDSCVKFTFDDPAPPRKKAEPLASPAPSTPQEAFALSQGAKNHRFKNPPDRINDWSTIFAFPDRHASTLEGVGVAAALCADSQGNYGQCKQLSKLVEHNSSSRKQILVSNLPQKNFRGTSHCLEREELNKTRVADAMGYKMASSASTPRNGNGNGTASNNNASTSTNGKKSSGPVSIQSLLSMKYANNSGNNN